MKNRIFLTLIAAVTVCSVAQADIQSPPGHHFNWSRKLSRGIGNLLYGAAEPFNVWNKTNASDGGVAAASDFFVEGLKRMVVRAGYGVYEVATFPVPSWKLTYRPMYYRHDKIDPWWGYTEFAPQPGALSQVAYSRTQGW